MQTTTHFTIILIMAGLAVLLALPAEQVQAQTPVTNIENAAGNSVFTVFDDGALLGLGEVGTGVIPAEGSGSRMMWYPAEAAFRAGTVNGSQWDASNVGIGSVAMGRGTTANSSYAVALGSNTTASGRYSTATGNLTTASGRQSTAMGVKTTAATDYSLTMGACNDANRTADGTLFAAGNGTPIPGGCEFSSDALVLDDGGHLTTAGAVESKNGGFVLPDGTTLDEAGDLESLPTNSGGTFDLSNEDGLVASGTFNGSGTIPATGAGTRMMWYPERAAFRAGKVVNDQWDFANVGEHSVAFGSSTVASGNSSTAMGSSTTASGIRSTAMGSISTASGDESTAMGDRTIASASHSVAMGIGTTASGDASTAMGNNTTASGDESTAIGAGTTAASRSSLSIGQYNNANSSADNTLFVAGNGSNTTPSDALVLDASGNLTISGTLSDASDRRLKKQIKPLSKNIVRKLEKIDPVHYQFKNQKTHPAGPQIGLIAQEVQKQFPELVSKASDGYLSVSYSKFTAVLLKGLQEQQQKIENQQTTIDQLEKKTQRIAALEKQVSKIKQNRQMAGLPVSAVGILLLGMAIGGGLWWQSRNDEGK